MKIAVTYENGEVYQHFGHCKQFKIYDIEKGEVKSSGILDAPGTGHTSAVNFLIEHGVYGLICGSIGAEAKNALNLAFIDVYGGCSGSCDDRINEFLGKKLSFNSDPKCDSCSDGGHSCGGCCGGCC
ncbi:MAG: NifB/NifX family molybdenum-iron cluster-binding protein [bacterium]|nr:NifB/NifX family molybdenum-iron cluster-binding protein [bacterium]